jgi:hypothetical protein
MLPRHIEGRKAGEFVAGYPLDHPREIGRVMRGSQATLAEHLPISTSWAMAARASPTSMSMTWSNRTGGYRRGENACDAYNVANGDYITVTEIAQLAVGSDGASPRNSAVSLQWRRIAAGKATCPWYGLRQNVRAIGWRCRHSTHCALQTSMRSMLDGMRARAM